MIMTDQSKIRISREILSNGPGYRVHPAGIHIRNGKDMTKRHMGKAVESIYIPTSPEWEPPDYLMGRWWKVVNEAGNTVGLKAYIPHPESRRFYDDHEIRRRKRDLWARTQLGRLDDAANLIDWPWVRRPPARADRLLRRSHGSMRELITRIVQLLLLTSAAGAVIGVAIWAVLTH